MDTSLLRIEKHEQGTIVTPVQKQFLSATESRPLWDQIGKLAQEPQCQSLVIDLTHVTFISSEILGEFIELTRAMKRRAGTLYLSKVCKEILDVVKLMKLDEVLMITDDSLQPFRSETE